MEKHVRIVGNIFIAKGLLSFFWVTFSVAFLPHMPSLFFLLVIPNLLVGIALRHRRPWARSAGICLAAMNLPYLPFGTMISLYMLWVLLSRRTGEIFLPSLPNHLELPISVKRIDSGVVRCPYCRERLKPSDLEARCIRCQTLHHKECWDLNGSCTTFGCRSGRALSLPVRV